MLESALAAVKAISSSSSQDLTQIWNGIGRFCFVQNRGRALPHLRTLVMKGIF